MAGIGVWYVFGVNKKQIMSPHRDTLNHKYFALSQLLWKSVSSRIISKTKYGFIIHIFIQINYLHQRKYGIKLYTDTKRRIRWRK